VEGVGSSGYRKPSPSPSSGLWSTSSNSPARQVQVDQSPDPQSRRVHVSNTRISLLRIPIGNPPIGSRPGPVCSEGSYLAIMRTLFRLRLSCLWMTPVSLKPDQGRRANRTPAATGTSPDHVLHVGLRVSVKVLLRVGSHIEGFDMLSYHLANEPHKVVASSFQ